MTADLTIREVRTTLLQLPWADDPWLFGHALGKQRDLVVVEIVTASGLSAQSAPASRKPSRRASSGATRRR